MNATTSVAATARFDRHVTCSTIKVNMSPRDGVVVVFLSHRHWICQRWHPGFTSVLLHVKLCVDLGL